MRKTIAIILGAFILMAVPLVSFGSDDAITDKTELIYDPSELNLSTPIVETLEGLYWYLSFNYVTGPTLATSLITEDVDMHALHSRWYIDIWSHTSSWFDNINYLAASKPNGPYTNDFNYWCWSACV